MSVNGITSSLLSSLGTLRPQGQPAGSDRAGQAGQAGVQRAATTPAALKPQTPIAAQAQASVPAEAPAGTDPALWSVLTSEERNFFAKSTAAGPLTYSRIKAVTHPAPPAARGVRLDVRA
ncbi:MAG: hypothetical protein LCH84_06815 [Gemmatimonadetes bacterium]|nr:hypothetical protein [Gemmatimonadota bacterium]